MTSQPCSVVGRQRRQASIIGGCALVGVLLLVVLVGCANGPGGSVSHSPGAAPTPVTFASVARAPTPTATATPIPPGLDAQQPQILANLGHPAKAILVSIDHQTLYAYQHGALVTWSYVTTGRPELQTPRGYYAVTARLHPTTFYSKWPPGSPYYYPPTHVNYALRFLGRDFFLHDYSPRKYYGPGTNVWHQNPDGTWETGSHGCVEAPLETMQWLYNWTPPGTPIVVY